MEPLLLVIDMQNGFVTGKTEHVVPGIKTLVEHFNEAGLPVAFTRFINRPDGGHVKWIGWSRLMAEPETDLAAELRELAVNVFDKNGYTAFTSEFERFLQAHNIDTLILCGIATDGCVLKSAVDAFERNIRPLIVQDACASHGGDALHRAGLQLLARFVGGKQLVNVQDIIEMQRSTAT